MNAVFARMLDGIPNCPKTSLLVAALLFGSPCVVLVSSSSDSCLLIALLAVA